MDFFNGGSFIMDYDWYFGHKRWFKFKMLDLLQTMQLFTTHDVN